VIDFKKRIERLTKAKGYVGSAILNSDGEILYIEDSHTGTDVAYATTMLYDTLNSLNDISVELGFAETCFLETKTEDGHIFLIETTSSSCENESSKVAVCCIFRDDGNITLAKMLINRIAKNIAEELDKL